MEIDTVSSAGNLTGIVKPEGFVSGFRCFIFEVRVYCSELGGLSQCQVGN
jgi:hypothetical protein